MGKKRNGHSVEGGSELSSSPFDALNLGDLPAGPAPTAKPTLESQNKPAKSRGRLDVKREKSGRGGKTVTVVSGWKGISNEEKLVLAKSIQKRCGVGGAVKGGAIEIQGDKREEVKSVLESAGFRVVFAGG